MAVGTRLSLGGHIFFFLRCRSGGRSVNSIGGYNDGGCGCPGSGVSWDDRVFVSRSGRIDSSSGYVLGGSG